MTNETWCYAQGNKPNSIWFHLYEVVKLTMTESRMVIVGSWGKGGNEEVLFNGYRISVLQDKEFWRWMIVMIAQQREST